MFSPLLPACAGRADSHLPAEPEPKEPKQLAPDWPSSGKIELRDLSLRYIVLLVVPFVEALFMVHMATHSSLTSVLGFFLFLFLSYSEDGPNVVHNISCVIQPGEKIGIVGSSDASRENENQNIK